MWNSLLGLGIVIGLGLVYIFAFRANHKDGTGKSGCGTDCAHCSGCAVNKELKDVVKK